MKIEDWLILAMVFVSLIGGYFTGSGIGYRDGQIDALTGNIKYELVTQPDSTRTWEEIK